MEEKNNKIKNLSFKLKNKYKTLILHLVYNKLT